MKHKKNKMSTYDIPIQYEVRGVTYTNLHDVQMAIWHDIGNCVASHLNCEYRLALDAILTYLEKNPSNLIDLHQNFVNDRISVSDFQLREEVDKKNCKYYNNNPWLKCAVHPNNNCKGCLDFKVI